MTRWFLFIQDLLLHHFLGLYCRKCGFPRTRGSARSSSLRMCARRGSASITGASGLRCRVALMATRVTSRFAGPSSRGTGLAPPSGCPRASTASGSGWARERCQRCSSATSASAGGAAPRTARSASTGAPCAPARPYRVHRRPRAGSPDRKEHSTNFGPSSPEQYRTHCSAAAVCGSRPSAAPVTLSPGACGGSVCRHATDGKPRADRLPQPTTTPETNTARYWRWRNRPGAGSDSLRGQPHRAGTVG